MMERGARIRGGDLGWRRPSSTCYNRIAAPGSPPRMRAPQTPGPGSTVAGRHPLVTL